MATVLAVALIAGLGTRPSSAPPAASAAEALRSAAGSVLAHPLPALGPHEYFFTDSVYTARGDDFAGLSSRALVTTRDEEWIARDGSGLSREQPSGRGTPLRYLTGIVMPMIIFGVGQGLGLSTLTTAGMAGVAPKDAGVAGGQVNVAHHTGGALGLGILVTVFAAAGAGAHGPQQLLADRVSASLTGAAIFLAAALLVTLITQRRAPRTALDNKRLAATQNLAHPGAEVLTEARAAA